jgi:hypothetical protein
LKPFGDLLFKSASKTIIGKGSKDVNQILAFRLILSYRLLKYFAIFIQTLEREHKSDYINAANIFAQAVSSLLKLCVMGENASSCNDYFEHRVLGGRNEKISGHIDYNNCCRNH